MAVETKAGQSTQKSHIVRFIEWLQEYMPQKYRALHENDFRDIKRTLACTAFHSYIGWTSCQSSSRGLRSKKVCNNVVELEAVRASHMAPQA